MKEIIFPQDQVYWYLQRAGAPPLRQSISTDVVVIGGGMAGLSAAQAFAARGKEVVLLEQYYCGAGASGKSSGFITPNSELGLTSFIEHYGKHNARIIWDFISSGVSLIKSNIHDHALECDYQLQDTISLANTKKALKELHQEYENLKKMGYETFYFTQDEVRNYVASDQYHGGMGYIGSFGIHAYQYCQQMKSVLSTQGVAIYEETPVLSIDENSIITAHATVQAKMIIVCADRFIPQLNLLKKEIYQMQTFLMLSQILTDQEMSSIFPQKKYMAWDSDLIYSYFRPTGQNRLLLGGGTYSQTYTSQEKHHYKGIYKKLTNYVMNTFGIQVQFEQQWPGLIGISKDIAPIAGPDKKNQNIYYIGAAAGLPIAAALGRYSAEHMLDGRNDLDIYFSPYRSFAIGPILQTILGKKISFIISNLITEFK